MLNVKSTEDTLKATVYIPEEKEYKFNDKFDSYHKTIAEEKAYAFIMKDGQIVERLEPATPSGGSVTFTRKRKAAGQLTGPQTVMVDFYVSVATGAVEMTIEPDKFGGFYYLEASTLFRRQDNGQDMAAAFVQWLLQETHQHSHSQWMHSLIIQNSTQLNKYYSHYKSSNNLVRRGEILFFFLDIKER